jgi:hypothetical protein
MVVDPGGSTTLNWTLSESNGGANISGHRISQSTNAGFDDPDVTHIYVGPNITTKAIHVTQPHWFKMVAYNMAGILGEETAVVSLSAPDPPGSLMATGGAGWITLDWTLPNPTTNITGYVIYQSIHPFGFDDPDVTAVYVGPEIITTKTIHGLDDNRSYYFKMVARTASGLVSEETPVVHSVTLVVPPGAPTLDVPDPSRTDSTLSLFWTAPASDGGADITGYRIEQSTTSASAGWVDVPNTGTTSTSPFTITGLTNDQQYWFRVSAINSVGTGTESSVRTATIALVPPGWSRSDVNTLLGLGWSSANCVTLANKGWTYSHCVTLAMATSGWSSSDCVTLAVVYGWTYDQCETLAGEGLSSFKCVALLQSGVTSEDNVTPSQRVSNAVAVEQQKKALLDEVTATNAGAQAKLLMGKDVILFGDNFVTAATTAQQKKTKRTNFRTNIISVFDNLDADGMAGIDKFTVDDAESMMKQSLRVPPGTTFGTLTVHRPPVNGGDRLITVLKEPFYVYCPITDGQSFTINVTGGDTGGATYRINQYATGLTEPGQESLYTVTINDDVESSPVSTDAGASLLSSQTVLPWTMANLFTVDDSFTTDGGSVLFFGSTGSGGDPGGDPGSGGDPPVNGGDPYIMTLL